MNSDPTTKTDNLPTIPADELAEVGGGTHDAFKSSRTWFRDVINFVLKPITGMPKH